jgi:V8-like Glu-specific endopeptidase
MTSAKFHFSPQKIIVCASILSGLFPLLAQLNASAQVSAPEPLVEITEQRDADGNRYYKNNKVFIKEVGDKERERAKKFWTPDNINEARPLETFNQKNRKPKNLKVKPPSSSSTPPQSNEKENLVPSNNFGEDLPPSPTSPSSQSWFGRPTFLMASNSLAGASFSKKLAQYNLLLAQNYPFSRSEVAKPYTTYPYRTIGRLVFVQGSSRGTCTATAITSPGVSLILTAAHCLNDGKNPSSYSRDVLFMPAYKDGATPYDSWTICKMYVAPNWLSTGNFSHDYALAKVCPRASDGKKIQTVIGSLGYRSSFVKTYNQRWVAFGYPYDSPPFSLAKRMYTCDTKYYADEPYYKPPTVLIGCDMTQGASGGPLINNFSETFSSTANIITGVLSDIDSYSPNPPNLPTTLSSPYFDSNFKALYDQAVADGA